MSSIKFQGMWTAIDI